MDKRPKVFQSVDDKIEERYCKYKWSLQWCLLTVLVLPVGGSLLHLLELVEDGARLALLHRVQPLRRRGVSLE